MKKLINVLKAKRVSGQPLKEIQRTTLYVAYLNKPLIELSAITDRYNDDYYDTSLRQRGTAYSISNSSLQGEDRIPFILSPEDEMMLQGEELSEYY